MADIKSVLGETLPTYSSKSKISKKHSFNSRNEHAEPSGFNFPQYEETSPKNLVAIKSEKLVDSKFRKLSHQDVISFQKKKE